MLRRLAPLLLLVTVLVGCDALDVPSTDVACTLIGCESQVVFEIGAPIERGSTWRVEACIDGRCELEIVTVPAGGVAQAGQLSIDAGARSVTLRLEEGEYRGTHAVALRLTPEQGLPIVVETETEFERLQPNGPDCEPVCWQATIRV